VTITEAIAYAKLNDHKMPREIAVQSELDRECLRVLVAEIERLRAEVADYEAANRAARELAD
jgi:uncharacterized small protein (DUF1192 family)